MLQRIQTVYLAIAAIALLIFPFLPVASFLSDMAYYKFSIRCFKDLASGVSPFPVWFTWPLLVVDLILVILAVWALVLFKNRVKQIKVTHFAVLVNVIFVAVILFVYSQIIERKTGIPPDYLSESGIYFPLVSLVFLVLANRAIKKDDKLVRSMDRLR